jgi:hypothetical protein
MHLSRARVAALAVFIASVLSPGGQVQAQACVVSRGDRIMLASLDLDPDVFVWDSPQRLIAYAAGDYNTMTVLRHTVLVKPGTTAIATDCKDGVARPKFSAKNVDIVGIKITSGAIRGRYGWVLAEDVRRMDGKPVTAVAP